MPQDNSTSYEQLKNICRQVYQDSVALDLPILEKVKTLALIMQNQHKMYKIHQPLNKKDWTDKQHIDSRIQNILEKICNGSGSANLLIKDFLLKNNYIQETADGLSTTPKL